MHPERQLEQAWRLLQQGKAARAEALCRRMARRLPAHGGARHLLGLAVKAGGDLRQAESHLRASIDLSPDVAEYHSNLGNLLRDLGRGDEAEASYARALTLDPNSKPALIGLVRARTDLGRAADAEPAARELAKRHPMDPQSWALLAATVRDQGRLEEAESLFRKSVAIGPRHAIAHHNLGALLSRMERAEQALAALERARELGVTGFELDFNLGRTYLQLNRFEESERAFAAAVAARPQSSEAQVNLARIRYMQGDIDFARAISAAADDGDPRLGTLHGIMLQRAGEHGLAERQFRRLLERHGPLPDAQSALAASLQEAGRLDEAEPFARAALEAQPDDPVIADNGIAVLLARDKADEAMPYIRRHREREPLGQRWLAYEATAARLLGDDRYQQLYDYERLIRAYDLEAPRGWSSMAELNAALEEALEARHGLPMRPLDQSLRNGSQTAHSLLTDADPAIQSIIAAFRAPLEAYCEMLGNDPRHPISSRNEGTATMSGAWSVRLRRDGFHVNHVHPEGWLSSAYYVSVPPEVRDETQKSGWLKFGEPRYPVPRAGAERHVQPRAGRLVLFPSYMWHGTTPILGDEPRMTIAFDAIPSRAS